ncbi:hypothetical protein SAMN05428949_2426 [Chitinophaga sp. YR627]|nr:hypothetical protein SAMN05428949_2426 [Chitinophaga sp. YR627]
MGIAILTINKLLGRWGKSKGQRSYQERWPFIDISEFVTIG